MLAGEYIPKHTFICEYKTSKVMRRDEADAEEKRHQFNQTGCYMVDVQHPVLGHSRVTLDATERMHNNPGRYINHVSKNPNICTWPLMEVRDKLRIGFVSLRDIKLGEELAWDYGVRDSALPFMKSGRFEEGRVVAGSGKEKPVDEVPKSKRGRLKTGRRYVFCSYPVTYHYQSLTTKNSLSNLVTHSVLQFLSHTIKFSLNQSVQKQDSQSASQSASQSVSQ